jgi:pimeloyl-ACP methyl ester carboxylesterase
MVPGEQAGWSSFGAAAGEAGYRALTFDFRGYGGSQGERDLSLSPEDIAGGIAFLREIGAERVIVIGAGQGGAGAIRLAASGESFTGLAVLSSSFSRDGIEISEADLAALTLPSLWIASRQDMLQDVEALYDLAGSPVKSIWMYEALGVHGTYILETMDGADLTRRLLDFAAFVEGGS